MVVTVIYGGARETRKIDNKTYYDWANTHEIVRELQPSAVMFSDAGPDVRWVGNERGMGSLTNWCLLNKDEMYPGGDFAKILGEGHEMENTGYLLKLMCQFVRAGFIIQKRILL